MRAQSLLAVVAGLVGAVGLSSCGQERTSWKQQWAEIKQSANYAYYCSVELCDEIEGAYEPECDCWCEYDGDEGDGDGGDETCDNGQDDVGNCDDGGSDDGGSDDGGGDDGGGDDSGGDDSGGDDSGGGDDVGDDGGGCTLTQGYWKNHNELQTNRNQAVDWPAPLDERDTMCGAALLDILNTRAGGEAWTILAHQYIAASLNAAAGADSSGIADELAQAGALLEGSCGGVSAADRSTAIELAELLDAYNNGAVGPGHCD